MDFYRNDLVQKKRVPNHFVRGDSHANQETDTPSLTPEMTPPDECLDLYVVVQYDTKPYPGLVGHIELGELHIDCVHVVGKSLNYRFFWPDSETNAGVCIGTC